MRIFNVFAAETDEKIVKVGYIAINKNNQIQYNYVSNYLKDNEIMYFDTVDECLDAVAYHY